MSNFPSKKQIREYNQNIKRDQKAKVTFVARVLIAKMEINELRRTTDQGTIKCPYCKGRLNWGAVGKKRHLRAVCETPNCIQFME
jgi:tRNA(Ile2) C34 agmatinyltransferase TiaS